MNNLQIFKDADCSIEVGNVLYEGQTYFLRLPTTNSDLIKSALAESGIADFVTWHRLNPIASLRVVNRIGLIKIFDRNLDIRSEKLLENETGERQFKIILDDLITLSRHIIFSNREAPSSNRSHNTGIQDASLLERFNYFRQTCLPIGTRLGIEPLIARILRNPHHRLVDEHVRDYIWNVKKPSRQTIRSLFNHDQIFNRLPSSHPLTVNRPWLKIPDSEESIFPLKALRVRGNISFDTPENRFIKHLLLDIEYVCNEINRRNLVQSTLQKQCINLLTITRNLINQDFFRDIGKLQTIPSSSPTLTQRQGYRELYHIFIRSRTAAKHLFEDIAEESLFIELKDISLLYEYWVFYKIAAALLGHEGVFLSRDAIVKNGKIVNSAVVTNGIVKIYFNKTFSRRPSGSYSLCLRPDVVVEFINNSDSEASATIHVLDAKYKSVESISDGEEDLLLKSTRIVKSADIHKMHCYADAIEGVKSAVAIYPGNAFVFYPKDRSIPPIKNPAKLESIEGVGAIPLLPGQDSEDFKNFMKKLAQPHH